MNLTELREFAERYAKAWCSQNPEKVAAFYAANGSLSVNEGPPAVGRPAIADVARGFMSAFPDMEVTMDDLIAETHGTVFRWTLTGTNTGSGGTGKSVRISGYELWLFDNGDLIELDEMRLTAYESSRLYKEKVKAYLIKCC